MVLHALLKLALGYLSSVSPESRMQPLWPIHPSQLPVMVICLGQMLWLSGVGWEYTITMYLFLTCLKTCRNYLMHINSISLWSQSDSFNSVIISFRALLLFINHKNEEHSFTWIIILLIQRQCKWSLLCIIPYEMLFCFGSVKSFALFYGHFYSAIFVSLLVLTKRTYLEKRRSYCPFFSHLF